MADTALTPFDTGTFGSRTTPHMAPQLRKAAAAARELLLDLAAEQLEASTAARWRSRTARSRDPPTGRIARLRRADQGPEARRRSIGDDAPTTPAEQLDGRRPRRCRRWTAATFVTGRHQYASDVTPPGHAATARCCAPPAFERHARLRRHGGRRGDARRDRRPRRRLRRRRRARRATPPTRRSGRHQAPSGRPTPQPSGEELFEYLQEPAGPRSGAAAAAVARRRGLGRGRAWPRPTTKLERDLHDRLHRPRAAGAAGRGGGVGGRQADRLDRHAAAVRRARRAGRGLPACRRTRSA